MKHLLISSQKDFSKVKVKCIYVKFRIIRMNQFSLEFLFYQTLEGLLQQAKLKCGYIPYSLGNGQIKS